MDREKNAQMEAGSCTPEKQHHPEQRHTHTHTDLAAIVLTGAFITARLPSTCYPVFRGVYLQWCRRELRETVAATFVL